MSVRTLMGQREWSRAKWDARLWPGRWVAQRRFEAAPVEAEHGPMYPCIGVYIVNGAAALGVDLDEHIEFCLRAMRENAEAIGL